MKKSIAKKWVKELRSGRYEQGDGRLVDNDDRFCCLGVLCNLAVDAGIGEWKKLGNGCWNFVTEGDADDNVLPVDVAEWAGMSSLDGAIDDDLTYTLARLNDAGKSFKELADIIEKNVEKL